MLNAVLLNLKSLDGLIFYSWEMLPEKFEIRYKILKRLISNNKIIYFALEELEVKNIKKLKELEKLIKIRKSTMKKKTINKIMN